MARLRLTGRPGGHAVLSLFLSLLLFLLRFLLVLIGRFPFGARLAILQANLGIMVRVVVRLELDYR